MEHGKRRERLQRIAQETLDAIETGIYTHDHTSHSLSTGIELSKKNTQYYAPDSLLSGWSTMRPSSGDPISLDVSVLEVSTLEGARLLSAILQASGSDTSSSRIGVLNFASATKPGGGFKNGAQAQEESIARSSTLYPTLTTPLAQTFYAFHKNDKKGGYYSHAMIYSPGVTVFRDDDGGWTEPTTIDVLTSAAVNAGVVRETVLGRIAGSATEDKIAKVMRERMARILFLFEKQGVKNVVLGSFGTGVFRNNVNLVANIWADLLLDRTARFGGSFEHVVFAILGRATFEEFERVFTERRSGYASA